MTEVIDAPEAPTTDITTLPPADRAALVLNSTKTEADLKQLATSLKAITLVNSPAGREQAHALAMTARTARTTIEKAGKAAREDATKFSKAVIAEEDRLIEIIQPEETRVLGLRNAWDAAEAARKEAELQKERDRIAAHQAVIAQIRSYPGLARECRTSEMAAQMLDKMDAIDISKLEEFRDSARQEKIDAELEITRIFDDKKAAEAEQARIKAEQEAEAARLAAERERLEAERAEAARVQAEQQAELLAQQARMKAQQEELDRQAAAMAKQAAELEAEQARQAAEYAAANAVTTLARNPREALGQIMGDALAGGTGIGQMTGGTLLRIDPSTMYAEPVIVGTPATVEQMHDTGNSIMYGNEPDPVQETPSAITIIRLLASDLDVESWTAIRWLAERADEFKTLHAESTK
jgi:hypothetical protein